MSPPRAAVCCLAIGMLAVAAVAASHAGPVEAKVPPEQAVPGAERVEAVLRAKYVMPEGRGRALAEFLSLYATPGIDVRAEPDGLTVVAPPDAQRALGTFVDKCLRHGIDELPDRIAPTPASPFEGYGPDGASSPAYENSRSGDFGAPAPAPEDVGLGPVRGDVPTYDEPTSDALRPLEPVRKKASGPAKDDFGTFDGGPQPVPIF